MAGYQGLPLRSVSVHEVRVQCGALVASLLSASVAPSVEREQYSTCVVGGVVRLIQAVRTVPGTVCAHYAMVAFPGMCSIGGQRRLSVCGSRSPLPHPPTYRGG